MSLENVKLFFEKVRNDEQMQEKVENLSEGNRQHVQAKMVKIGAEAGFEFNETELQQMMEETTALMQQREELDDAQLDVVAGGIQVAWDIVTEIDYAACVISMMHDRCDPNQYIKNKNKYHLPF